MKALITGANGFVGGHLADYLQQVSIEVHGTDAREPSPAIAQKFASIHTLDIRDTAAVQQLITSIEPQMIFHLAAITFVPESFDAPWRTFEVNVHGTLNVLEAARKLSQTRVLVISSSEVYGVIKPEDLPLRETQPFNPGNPYSVSKVSQEVLGLQYHLAHHLDVLVARPFNHVGPGQNPRFVLADFATQIARMEKGQQEPVLRVGNLAARRDFSDVRDVVRAYHLLITHGEPGQVYNICQGKAYVLKELVEMLVGMANLDIEIKVETERLRPIDVPLVVGDYRKLHDRTGWEPKIDISTTIKDILDDCRAIVSQS